MKEETLMRLVEEAATDQAKRNLKETVCMMRWRGEGGKKNGGHTV